MVLDKLQPLTNDSGLLLTVGYYCQEVIRKQFGVKRLDKCS